MKQFGIPQYLDGRTGDKALSKAVNRARLLDMLRSHKGFSRAALAKSSGLNKTTVSSQIAELIELGIVREIGMCASSMGRKPVMIEIDSDSGYALGISISSTNLHVVAMNAAGEIKRDETIPSPDCSPEGIVKSINSIIKAAKKEYGKTRFGLYGVGVAVPGTVDRDSGNVIRSAKLGWEGVPLKQSLSKGIGAALEIGNDATLATIAEHELHAPESRDFACLLIDEGIGSGAYINGVVYYGGNGQFGEVGHMTIVHDGARCPCGNIGCWDLYGSELALRQALTSASKGRDSSGARLEELAASPPEWSRKAFSRFVDYLVTGVVNILNSMTPSTIVINSAVLSASPMMFEKLKSGVSARALARATACDIRLSSLRKDAPAVGAAISATDRFFKSLVLDEDVSP
jgi:predicted NBD/HSP70 family sugar kinase